MKNFYISSLLTATLTVGSFLAVSAAPLAATQQKNRGSAWQTLFEKASPQRQKGSRAVSGQEMRQIMKRTVAKGEYVGDGPFMIGASIVSSDEFDPGIYVFNEHGEIGTVKTGYTLLNATYGGVKAHGRYFLANSVFQNGKVVNFNILYNAETWQEMARNEDASPATFSYSMAEDPTDGKVYGCFLTGEDGESLELGTIDIDNLTRTGSIAPISTPWMAMGFDEDGVLYALLQDGTFNRADKSTGKLTLIGKTDIPMDYLTSGVMNRRDGKFYYASCTDTENKLYAINPADASVTEVIDFGMFIQMRGMFMWDGLAEDKAPFAAQYLEMDFEPGQLSGFVKFHVPEIFYDGTEASGDVSYSLQRTGTEVATGKTEWGKDERIPFEVDHAAPYRVSVFLSNEAGTSPEASLRVWIGNDHPAVPANVHVERDGDNNIVSWDAVNAGAHSGYVNPAQITYTVKRFPDEVIVAENLTATTFVDVVPEPAKTTVYRYEVTAIFDGRESEPGLSDVLPLGALRLPFYDDFTAIDADTKYKVIDANGDGNTWEFSHQKRGMFVKHAPVPMDDWLISPPFRMEAGKLYTVSFVAIESFEKYGPEKIEAYYGQSPTAAGMTKQLIAPTLIPDRETLTGTMTVDTDGTYYLGIHGISDPDAFYLYVSDIRIEDGVYPTSPDRAELTVVPDYNGADMATLTAVAPTLDVSGNPVGKLTKLQFIRDDEVIYEVPDPEPGNSYEYLDNVPGKGYYTYGLKAFDVQGAGKLTELKSHVGMNLPAAPTNVRMIEKDDSGKVTITWDAPLTDIDGNAKNPDMLSYSIFDYNNDEVVSYLSGTSYTTQAGDPGSQKFVLFYVHAESPAGMSETVFGRTNLTAVGSPYTLPFYESFSNGILAHLWAQNGGGDWLVLGASEEPVATPADNDGGMLAWKPVSLNTEGRIFSGKIKLDNTVNPSFVFSYFAVPSSANGIKIGVRNLTDDSDMEYVAAFNLSDGNGWTKAVADLSKFAGKNVEVSLTGVCVDNLDNMLFDDLRIIDMMPENLTANTIAAPRKITSGDIVKIEATIDNNGSNDAENFDVELYCNRLKVDSKKIGRLMAGRTMNVTFDYKTTPFSEDNLVFYIHVNYAADGDKDDNTTERVTVEVIESKYPAATGLAVAAVSPLELTWIAPGIDESDAGETTEGFEDMDAFAINPEGKWSFIDGDQSATYSIPKVQFAGNGGRIAYVVIDDRTNGLNASYAAHSGHKYIASLAAQKGGNDDWLISPLLTGEEQTVSFYAKTYSAQYLPEAFNFLYSTSDNTRESFVELAKVPEVPSDNWTKYEYTIPAGTKYFAIQCVSPDSFIFMVDDITYSAASIMNGLELEGYNLYRDGDFVSETGTPGYVDNDVPEGSHTYHVTARYNKGESMLSEPLTVDVSSVKYLDSESVAVSAESGRIFVTAPAEAEIAVFSGDAIQIYSGNGSCTIEVPKGIYIVTVAHKAYKVII